ncbi:hypothetical protein SAY87_002240 [Trapa incisa]|uniref:cinnamyl-alcohol dehydrogenase n=1 Tax=Trapa incisa TaxID=236973 RepID=A0AAN7JUH8_9MYRT|nr:hypothetical protein SAY87_002240 [Trapa incisa]
MAKHEHPVAAFGWAARDSSGHLSPFNFSRRATGENDVTFKVLYCGICHSDLHNIRNEWGGSTYPMVPGYVNFELNFYNCIAALTNSNALFNVWPPNILRHEVVGVVTEVGSKVTKFKVGDKSCANDLENYCPDMIVTYNSKYNDGTTTHGGYSNIMVADEHFVVAIPDSLPLDGAAPLLCAGITVYSPLRYYGLDKPGLHVGVVGLGGLGHMAVKFAKAMGLKVTVISTSPSKKQEAIERLGADSFLDSRDQEDMQSANGTMDGIIDTVSAIHPLQPLLGLLKSNGKLVMVGAPSKPLQLPAFSLLIGRKAVGGSIIGGLKETQEMINFASEHGIVSDIEVIPMDYVNKAMERLERADVRYRFVIDIENSLKIAA